MLRDGQSWLQDQMEQWAASEVEYQRVGTVDWLACTAIIGRSANNVETATGLTVQSNNRDFIIRVSFFDQFAEKTPKRNDAIRVTENGNTLIYKVNSDGVVSHFEEVDGYGIVYRVHSVRDWFVASS